MNFRVAGTVIMVFAAVSAIGGTSAGTIASLTVGVEQQSSWAMGCFNGDISQCQMNRDHDQDVKDWTDRGILIVLGASAFFILGASLFAGSLGRRKDAELADEPDTPLTEEEAETLARLERDAALMRRP